MQCNVRVFRQLMGIAKRRSCQKTRTLDLAGKLARLTLAPLRPLRTRSGALKAQNTHSPRDSFAQRSHLHLGQILVQRGQLQP